MFKNLSNIFTPIKGEGKTFDQRSFVLTIMKGSSFVSPIIAKATFSIPELAQFPVKLKCQWFFQPEGKNTMIEFENHTEAYFQPILDDIGGKILLQAIPDIEPHTYEGGPLFAEVGPINVDQVVWNKSKKIVETGGHVPCKITYSAIPDVNEKTPEPKLVINSQSKVLSIKSNLNGSDLVAFNLEPQESKYKFIIERKEKPGDFSLMKDDKIILKFLCNDFNDRDPFVLSLRTISTLNSLSIGGNPEKEDYIKLAATINQLKEMNDVLEENKQSLQEKIQTLEEKIELMQVTQNQITLAMATIEERDKKNSEIASTAQEKIDSLAREKQFYFNELTIVKKDNERLVKQIAEMQDVSGAKNESNKEIDKWKEICQKLEKELTLRNDIILRKDEIVFELQEEKSKSCTEIERLENELQHYKKVIESLLQEKKILRANIGAIATNKLNEKDNQRIIQLQNQQEEIKQENTKLKGQLQALEVKLIEKEKSGFFTGMFSARGPETSNDKVAASYHNLINSLMETISEKEQQIKALNEINRELAGYSS